jgi:dTDP-glucose pyrophosphorylase
MTTSQAVILARGLGTRMRRSDGAALSAAESAVADTGVKALMPTGEHAVPFLDFVLSALADAGIGEVVIVVGPGPSALRERYVREPPARLAVRFAVQEQPRGTADAALAACDAVRNAPFLVLNADNYYSPSALGAAARIGECGLVAYEAESLAAQSGIERDRILRYALIDIGPDDILRSIREKPAADDPLAAAPERWVSMNLWSFTPVIFEACQRVRPSQRGELELQDAVSIAMRDLRVPFRVVRMRDSVLDLSQRADVAQVSDRLSGVRPRP